MAQWLRIYFNLQSCEALDYRQKIGHNPEITKGQTYKLIPVLFIPKLTKNCEFSSSLLLSLFQKILLSIYFFPYSQFCILFTKIVNLFKFIVSLYFSGKLTAIGSVDDLVRVIWNSSESCTHFLISSFPCFSFWNFFLFHF